MWAIDIISANKLYVGGFEGFKILEERVEVKAWTDLIALKSLPLNKLELDRLKQYEVHEVNTKNDDKTKLILKKSGDHQVLNSNSSRRKKDENGLSIDDSRLVLLNQSVKGGVDLTPSGITPTSKISIPGFNK